MLQLQSPGVAALQLLCIHVLSHVHYALAAVRLPFLATLRAGWLRLPSAVAADSKSRLLSPRAGDVPFMSHSRARCPATTAHSPSTLTG